MQPLEPGARVWPQGQCSPSAPEPGDITHGGPTCRGAVGLAGRARRLPGSPGSGRQPKASSPHTSKGKPPYSSPGSSFSAGNSQGCLGPRCGMGWDGSPHAHPPQALLSCIKAPLSYPKPSLCSTYILLGQRGRRKILPCRGTGGAARKGCSPCTDPQGTPKRVSQRGKGETELTASPKP